MTKSSLVALLFSLGGLLLIVASALWVQAKNFIKSAVRTRGQVVEILYNDIGETPEYTPRFEFTDQDGNSRIVLSKVSAYPCRFEVGEIVELLYLPGQPETADYRGFMPQWAIAFGVAAFGIAAVLLAVVIARAAG